MERAQERIDNVKEYYSKVVQSTKDLKTNACCTGEDLPSAVREILPRIAPEILEKFYGCGSPIPADIEGCAVVDLGCGTGRDSYILSRLVGRKGRVIGVDMNDTQLEVAQRHIELQMKNFGFTEPNIEFKKGYIENLKEIGIGDGSQDVVISNCVINLSPDKESVFREAFRVLKPGGELYFSDVFAGRRVPKAYELDPVLVGECLGGALYIEDFRRLLRGMGRLDYRIASKRRLSIDNVDIETKVGMIDFYSMTIRVFKLDDLEDICEDYGQCATYLGTMPDHPHAFRLDDHHIFISEKPMLVCGNTASMLKSTRFAKHFKVEGDRTTHYGPFNCAPASAKIDDKDSTTGGACC